MHFHLHADGSESRGEMRRNACVADDIDAKKLKRLDTALRMGFFNA